ELEKTAHVYIDGKKASIKSLTPKMKVFLQKPFSKPGIERIEAGPKVVGVVKVVHADKKSIAVKVPGKPMGAEEFSVADDAPVLIDGTKSKLADLRPGARVSLQMSAESE